MRPPGWRERLSRGWLLRALLARRGAILAPLGAAWQPGLRTIRATRRLVPLLMSDAAALQIQICVAAMRSRDGAMAEAGVLMGGSARLICDAKGDRPLHLFDVFETLQPARAGYSAAEAEIRSHFGAIHGTRASVERLLAPYPNVHLHPGLFPQSAAGLAPNSFSFVHVDLDLPETMRAALAFFRPRMVPGGILIGDDCNDPAVRAVFTRFFAGRDDTLIDLPWGQLMVIATAA